MTGVIEDVARRRDELKVVKPKLRTDPRWVRFEISQSLHGRLKMLAAKRDVTLKSVIPEVLERGLSSLKPGDVPR